MVWYGGRSREGTMMANQRKTSMIKLENKKGKERETTDDCEEREMTSWIGDYRNENVSRSSAEYIV